MIIRSVALLAMFAACCPHAIAADASLAVYYSFDAAPPAAVFSEIQSELSRIVNSTGLRVAWRPMGVAWNGVESFGDVAVLHFSGRCFFDGSPAEAGGGIAAGAALGQTDVANGRVLSFGNVNCDSVRLLIAPVLNRLGTAGKNAALGRALARVTAHELYHMLTGSEVHAKEGIARAKHSPDYLTAPAFNFARPEMDWLQNWAGKQGQIPTVPASLARAEQPDALETATSIGR